MGILYQLTFANGKRYIGITTRTLQARLKGHACYANNGSNTLVHRTWRKYGAPSAMVLAVVENEDLPGLEIKAIQVFNTLAPNGCNLSYGGDISPMVNPDVAKRSSESGRAARIGGKHTDAHKAKISAALKGVAKSPQHCENLKGKGGRLGYKHTEEARASMSKTRKGRKLSDAHRAAIAEATRKQWIIRKSKDSPERVIDRPHGQQQQPPTGGFFITLS